MSEEGGTQAAGRQSAGAVHATALAVGETGILIRGASGAGKSSLALSLLHLAAQAGQFGRLVGDDRILLGFSHGRIIARGHPATYGMIEARGRGILRFPYEPAVVLRLTVDLLPKQEIARFPGLAAQTIELCGAKLPRLALLSDRSSYDCAQLVMAYLHHDGTI